MAEDETSALFFEKVMSMGWPVVLSGFSGMRNWPGNCRRAQGDRALRNHDGNENYRRMMEIYHEILETV